jgi:hypothetical protein
VDLWVYMPLYVGFALTVVTPRIARILPPRTGVWCLTAAAVTAAVSWVLSLSMIGLTGLGRVAYIATEGHWSASRWRAVDPVGVWTARVAGAILVTGFSLFLITMCREVSSRRQVRRITSGLASDRLLVIVDDDKPHAYAVSGRRPRIVISRGMLRGMDGAERRAVLAHEIAHLHLKHDVHLRILRLAAAANPLLRQFVPAGHLAVERWADEEAAASLGERTLVARTLLRAALAGAGGAPRPAGAMPHVAGDIELRVTALLRDPPRPRWSMTAIAMLLLVATIVMPFFEASNLDSKLNRAEPATSAVLVRR